MAKKAPSIEAIIAEFEQEIARAPRFCYVDRGLLQRLIDDWRRLAAQMSDPESWPVGYCAVCDTAMRQSPNGQWWHEDTTHDHVAVHEDAYR